jgi:hypothetical protein
MSDFNNNPNNNPNNNINIEELNQNILNQDDIYLITQFFIPSNLERKNELIFCLKENINLNIFKNIFLINEKEYTKDEIQLTDTEMSKIKQICFKKNNSDLKGERMKYIHPLILVQLQKLKGYVVVSNSDIFFDNTLKNLYKTSLSIKKSFYALLRFEFDNSNPNISFQEKKYKSNLFGPRPDSQDTWILHTNFLPNNRQIIKCNFELGMPGCDNSIAYLFHSFGYKIYNEPFIVKTYHYHTTNIRNYNRENTIPPPYMTVKPIIRRQ